jgi:hypothetical protein
MCHRWKQFRCWFLRLQGLFALSNPCVTCGSSFVDDFWDGSDSVFVDNFWARMCSLRCRIHASPVEAVLLMISEYAGALYALESMHHPWKYFVDDFWVLRGCLCFQIHKSPVGAVSFMIYEATGAVCAVESMRHLWKQFCWWFVRRQRLSFR